MILTNIQAFLFFLWLLIALSSLVLLYRVHDLSLRVLGLYRRLIALNQPFNNGVALRVRITGKNKRFKKRLSCVSVIFHARFMPSFHVTSTCYTTLQVSCQLRLTYACNNRANDIGYLVHFPLVGKRFCNCKLNANVKRTAYFSGPSREKNDNYTRRQ